MNQKKIKKRFYRQEKIRTKLKIFRIRCIVNEVLKESFGRRLYNLKHDDEFRLLTLYVWKDRYKISIKYILKILIPIWSKKFSRFKMKTSLGCRVSTLVGKKSEEIIREKIWKDFPNKKNINNWIQSEKDKIYKLVGSRKPLRESKYKSILDAPNPEAFIKQYKSEIKNKKTLFDKKQSNNLKNIKLKAYRNNPWQS